MSNLVRRIILAITLIAGLAPAFAAAPPAVPALPDTERRTSYTITSSTCACAVNFAVYGDSTDYQNWVEVWLNGVQVQYNDSTFGWMLTSPTGSIGNIPRPITDAVITFNNPQTGTVQIVGARRPRRVAQFPENRGVAARDLNQALTDVVAQNRETWDKINDVTGRALISQPGTTIKPLPPSASCAGKFLGFDVTGTTPLCASGGAGSGNVVGPLSSTDGHFALFNGTSGALLKDGGAPAPSATTDTTNAGNISSGTLPVGRLPIATNSQNGAVHPDGTSVTVDGSGTLTATGGSVMTSYAALRASTHAATAAITWVQGRVTSSAQGSGNFQLDPSDVTSSDNDGTILVDASGNRWKRQYSYASGVRVDWFNFLTTNTDAQNATAIAAAIATLPVVSGAMTGKLIFPIGTYQYTTMSFDNAVGLLVTSDSGGRSGTNLTCTATCITARSTFNTKIQNLMLTATTGAGTNCAVDLEHVPSSNVDTRGFILDNVMIDGASDNTGTAYSLCGVNTYQASNATLRDVSFLRLATGVHGQATGAPSGTNYSNNVTIINPSFAAMQGFPLVNPGQNWTMIGGYTEVLNASSGFLSDGAGRVVFSDPTANVWQNLVIINHSVYDATAGGSDYIDVGSGTNLQVIGGLWGGISGSNMMIARGVVSDVRISTQASNFSAIAFANVSGQLNWGFSGTNLCSDAAGTIGCSSSLVGNPSNVTNLNTDGVTPNSSQGVNGTNGWRINPDGTKEVWGQMASVASGTSTTVSFSSAFGTACYNAQVFLVTPATASNVISMNGSCTTTGQSVFVNGTGTNTVSYHAIGR